MTTYNKIVKKLFKRHAKFYMLKHDSVFVYLTATVSYYVTPIFIFLKFTPNSITFLNFLIS